MTKSEAKQEFDKMLQCLPEYGEVSLRVVVHGGQIVRLEKGMVEKVQGKSDRETEKWAR
jgi:hypothetical protein